MVNKSNMQYFLVIIMITVFCYLLLFHPTGFEKKFRLTELKQINSHSYQLPHAIKSNETMIHISNTQEGEKIYCSLNLKNKVFDVIQMPPLCLENIKEIKPDVSVRIIGQIEFIHLLIGR
jgi:hypothetical protein